MDMGTPMTMGWSEWGQFDPHMDIPPQFGVCIYLPQLLEEGTTYAIVILGVYCQRNQLVCSNFLSLS